jgi:hypothetical protein
VDAGGDDVRGETQQMPLDDAIQTIHDTLASCSGFARAIWNLRRQHGTDHPKEEFCSDFMIKWRTPTFTLIEFQIAVHPR